MKVKQQVLRNSLKTIGATASNQLKIQHFCDILIKKQPQNMILQLKFPKIFLIF